MSMIKATPPNKGGYAGLKMIYLTGGREGNRTPVLQWFGSAITCVPVFLVSGKTSRSASFMGTHCPSSKPDDSGIPADYWFYVSYETVAYSATGRLNRVSARLLTRTLEKSASAKEDCVVFALIIVHETLASHYRRTHYTPKYFNQVDPQFALIQTKYILLHIPILMHQAPHQHTP